MCICESTTECTGDDDTTIHYDDKAIEALLDRDMEIGETDGGAIGSDNLLANDYLSSFKVASYVMKETDQVCKSSTYVKGRECPHRARLACIVNQPSLECLCM